MNQNKLVRFVFSLALGLSVFVGAETNAAVTSFQCDKLLGDAITQKKLSIHFMKISRMLYGAQASMYKTMSVNAQNLSNSFASQFVACTITYPIIHSPDYSAVSGGDGSDGGAGIGSGGDGAGGGL